jgi:hypothetical protein
MKSALILIILGFAQTVFSSDFQSPRTLSLGGSGHAGPLLNDAIYLNPSFISFNQTYGLGFSYLKYSDSNTHGRNLNFSLQDGRTELFQAGVGYTIREEASLINLGISKAVLPNQLAVGVGAKFLFNRSHESSRDFMVAAAAPVQDWLQLGFSIDNVMESSKGKRQGLYRESIAGSKFNIMNIVLVYFDPHVTPSSELATKWGHETGFEFTVMRDLFLRTGIFQNASQPHQGGYHGSGFSLGGGWVAPRVSIDYGFSKITSSPSLKQRVATHQIGFTAFF